MMREIIGQNLWDLCIDCQVLAAACIMEGGGGCGGACQTWGHRQLEGGSLAYEGDWHALIRLNITRGRLSYSRPF